MATPIRSTDSMRHYCTPEEWEARIDLACAYRAAHAMGWNKSLIYNHISMRVPGTDDSFLINPFGLRYDEITASNLVKVDRDGNKLDPSPHSVLKAGFLVHSAIHRARDDLHAVIHTHTMAGLAVACHRDGLLPLGIESLSFTGRLAYHDIEGPVDDEGERERMAADLGDKNFMVLRNHGLLACGATMAEAFHDMMTLEFACEAQVVALGAGDRLAFAPDDIARASAEFVARHGAEAAKVRWAAVRRWMEKLDAGFME